MIITKRSLNQGANVCIIDDFMKAGGTIDGMKNLLKEFDAKVAGIGVLAEAEDEEDERIVSDYISLLQIATVDEKKQQDRKSTRLNSSHVANSYAVFCLK